MTESSHAPTPDPLIVTLEMDPATFAHFDGLRRRHFPEKLNHIPAHATLFHHLPGGEEDSVAATLAELNAAEEPVAVEVTGLRFLGRGVAYTLASDTLARIRGSIARRYDDALTAQDRQGWKPHVTIQNKVSPEVARSLHHALDLDFEPFRFTATGLLLWRYLGGPWQQRGRFAFGRGR
ncbi:2'-5' RNA ligase family protein [Methylobacterium sp. 77]|uniref:2'-5' RNA ligase family protein n=1 Tax=Methylobacterium sp. 77 TaxID=1101192 RepID=UPI000376FD5D|nr:2'-5' RNA ligase family protein [Methylobacterium sp. 77]